MSNNKHTLIPKLRFPEFQNAGEWEVKKLGEVLEKNKEKNKDRKYTLVQSVSNKFGFINQDEYFENRIIASKDTSNYYVIRKGCFAYNPSRIDVGSLAYKNDENISIISPLYVSFKAKNDKVLDLYLLNWFRSNGFIEQMIFEGGVRNTLNFDNLIEISIPLPSLPEQEKIASCLSSLDEVITGEQQKLELLKQHKKGLLQNLFPQEGETVPKLRFKEFENSGEWEVKRLGEVCKFIRGPFGGALKKEIFISEGYAVYEQAHAIYGDFSSFRYFISEEKFNELKRFSVLPNDIIMSCSGTMGKFAIIPKNSKEGVINQALLKLTVKPGYEVNFIKTALELPVNQNKLLSQSAGGAIKNVVEVAQIKELPLLIPLIKEQQKISSCLSSLDDLITVQTQKIEQLQRHKKGLLQGLFPNMNEHHG